jgi:hypothetical protein
MGGEHLVESNIEFFGNTHRLRGVNPLPHLHRRHDHCDLAVGSPRG